jgi:hypothetical protein
VHIAAPLSASTIQLQTPKLLLAQRRSRRSGTDQEVQRLLSFTSGSRTQSESVSAQYPSSLKQRPQRVFSKNSGSAQ